MTESLVRICHSLLVGTYHVAHLVCDILEPCLLSFDLGDHMGEPAISFEKKRWDSLLPDDRLG